MKSSNVMTALVDIFISPSKAFNGLKEAKGWSFVAFILLASILAASMFAFYNKADPQFLIDQQVAAASVDATIAEQKMIRQSMEQTIDLQVWFAMFGGIIGLAVINALMAGYYLFVSKQDPEANYGYGAWYGFGVWAMMPLVIYYLGFLILVLTASTNQISQTLMNYSSINQLLIGLEIGHPFYTLLESLNIFSIWSIFIAAIGLKSWTNFTFNKALLFAALPSIVIYGIWTVIALV
ncbi:YIP1 family protein [Pseudoalteromonas shioyasakiensis]|uniref:YIP1 family protein n=1 Tax=Pseudoalteromonas shioyasakiensis TaxID=1190813 RepID=A0ABT6U4L9_9GAMM|nr:MULTISPECIES: YIP1 family protein [Pseudoalteromonas]MCO6356986.1 YIP1 family protein [Pseudoalteromonas shioyasakiensis]MDI4670611.1 YIP1 family protein [Pseudoalteromonas shioyasakiensis]MDI4674791.1 YIP1 family protein [Pseudoalteromonas shioyasakiensis]MDI4687520.1 YIP1 family protein [Pseudoalteromonas shioyasakiensis]MDI4706030.1 YIP1 family protein [Pseudoalteromonas shioyasakiensis]|tara:strand:- start:702 stop:1412 length:711 start_codon:yes stop_codon:yes gene_type:complete